MATPNCGMRTFARHRSNSHEKSDTHIESPLLKRMINYNICLTFSRELAYPIFFRFELW